jgi:hypothetical protein
MVSVVNARDPNDAFGSRGRKVLQYLSHRCLLIVTMSDTVHKLACTRTEDGLIIITLRFLTIQTKQPDQRKDEIRY